VPGFVKYKKGCTQFTAASDKVYQLLAHGWWLTLKIRNKMDEGYSKTITPT
jgi:hypothetical protein